jgi:site-specific DNA recombinase
MTRAFLYLRQSLDKTGEGLAVDRQRQACEDLCQARGWDIVETFTENDTSALRKRPKFNALLQRVERGEVDVIVVWHVDRLVRQLAQLETIISLCEKTGTKLATVSGDLDLSTDTGRLIGRILASVARGEIERKSTRQRSANAQRAEAGLPHVGGQKAFGYAKGGLALVDEEADAIRDGYATLLGGGSLRSIAIDWNSRGVFSGKPRWGKRREETPAWTFTAVGVVLKNPRNAGIRLYDGVEYPAQWPAIVPVETWRAAVALLSDPGRRSTGSYGVALLTQVATCGVCGATVHSGGGGRRGRDGANAALRYRVYRCSQNSGKHIARRADHVDELVRRLVIGRLSAPDAVQLFTRSNDQKLPALIADREAIRERQRALAEDFADGTMTPAMLKTASSRLTQRLEEVDARITAASTHSALQPLVTADDVEQAWGELDVDRQRAVIHELFSEVALLPVGRGTRIFRPESVRIKWRRDED